MLGGVLEEPISSLLVEIPEGQEAIRASDHRLGLFRCRFTCRGVACPIPGRLRSQHEEANGARQGHDAEAGKRKEHPLTSCPAQGVTVRALQTFAAWEYPLPEFLVFGVLISRARCQVPHPVSVD